MIIYLYISCFFCIFVLMPAAHAKKFSNSYCSFWVPDDWECKLEETEYICRPSNDTNSSKEILMILGAKYAGTQDSLAQYKDHLERDRDGEGSARVIKPPKLIRLGERQWIDATHKDSEIPNYFTRYLATVDGDIAMLITVSFYHTTENKYTDIIEQIAFSVRSHKLTSNN